MSTYQIYIYIRREFLSQYFSPWFDWTLIEFWFLLSAFFFIFFFFLFFFIRSGWRESDQCCYLETSKLPFLHTDTFCQWAKASNSDNKKWKKKSNSPFSSSPSSLFSLSNDFWFLIFLYSSYEALIPSQKSPLRIYYW